MHGLFCKSSTNKSLINFPPPALPGIIHLVVLMSAIVLAPLDVVGAAHFYIANPGIPKDLPMSRGPFPPPQEGSLIFFATAFEGTVMSHKLQLTNDALPVGVKEAR